jgi:hypothetical protein
MGQQDVALCLFGQMRSYRKTHKFLKKNIIEPLNPDIFVHTWRLSGNTWKYDNDNGEPVTEEELENLYSPTRMEIERFKEDYYWELEENKVPDKVRELPHYAKGILPMFYKMNKCNALKRDYEEREKDSKYDLVILIRPDLAVLSEIPQKVLENPNVVWAQDDAYGTGFHPYHIDDRFLITNSANMDYVTSIWENLEQYWKSELNGKYGEMGIPESYSIDDHVDIGRPERLLHYHLKKSPVDTDNHGIPGPILRPEETTLFVKYPRIHDLINFGIRGFKSVTERGLVQTIYRAQGIIRELHKNR